MFAVILIRLQIRRNETDNCGVVNRPFRLKAGRGFKSADESCKSRFRGQFFFLPVYQTDVTHFCDAELNIGNFSSISLLSCSPSAYSVPGLLSDKAPLLPRSLFRGYYRTKLPSSFILLAGVTFGRTFHPPLLLFILHICIRIIQTDTPVAYILFLPLLRDAFLYAARSFNKIDNRNKTYTYCSFIYSCEDKNTAVYSPLQPCPGLLLITWKMRKLVVL